jgi:hypothetical protein
MRGFACNSPPRVLFALHHANVGNNLIVLSLLLSIPTEHLDYSNSSK